MFFESTPWHETNWESAKVSHKRVFALLTPEICGYEMAQMLRKPVFALPGCQRMSVNTLLCDTLGFARNQYINNSPGIFILYSCGCEYRRGMYLHQMNSLKNLAQYSGNTSSKIFSCIRASANTGPACIRAKMNSPRIFPAYIGFVPGGIAVTVDVTLLNLGCQMCKWQLHSGSIYEESSSLRTIFGIFWVADQFLCTIFKFKVCSSFPCGILLQTPAHPSSLQGAFPLL